MDLYTCKVRLAGSLQNEVIRENVTAGEIMLLRRLHGQENVLEIKNTGEVDRTSDEEKERLRHTYIKTVEIGNEEVLFIDQVFPYGRDLPILLTGIPRLRDIPNDERDEPDAEAMLKEHQAQLKAKQKAKKNAAKEEGDEDE